MHELCVFYYCSGTREEPGTLTQGAPGPVFPGSSRYGIEPKSPGWLVQAPTTRPIGDLIPTTGGPRSGVCVCLLLRCLLRGPPAHELLLVCTCVCVFITAGPMIKLCAGGEGTVKDMCYEVRRAEACVD